jgi:hypothetical protein
MKAKTGKKAQKLGVGSVSQVRGGLKVNTCIKAGAIKHGPLDFSGTTG